MLPASGPSTPAGTALWLPLATFAGYAVFWSGVCVGFVNLGSGCVRARPLVRCIELENAGCMHSTQPQLVLLGLAEPPSFSPPCFPFCLYAPLAEFVLASPVARARDAHNARDRAYGGGGVDEHAREEEGLSEGSEEAAQATAHGGRRGGIGGWRGDGTTAARQPAPLQGGQFARFCCRCI